MPHVPQCCCKAFFCLLTSPEWSDQKIFWTAKSKTTGRSSGNRFAAPPRPGSGQGPRGWALRFCPFAGRAGNPPSSRSRTALTRAGQFYYQLAGRQPPSRQFDDSQPLIREGASDFILLRSGLKKLVRTLAPDGNYHLTKLGKAFLRRSTPSGWPTCRCGSAAAARTAGAMSGWITCP